MERKPESDVADTQRITTCKITAATSIDRKDKDGHPFGFCLHINDGESPTWFLRCNSEHDKKAWITRLAHVQTIVNWLDSFDCSKVLGVGGTGVVYEMRSKSNPEVRKRPRIRFSSIFFIFPSLTYFTRIPLGLTINDRD